ncbi:MAG: hypothetical protein JXK93_05320 [Sphaerochaetaceae bacterium]|nr:hypothetical protein [Sphaerochaetaceae bacterium]
MTTILIAAELTDEALTDLAQCGTLEFALSDTSPVLDKTFIKEKMKELDPEILIVDATTIDREVIDASSHLRLIHCTRGNPVNIDSGYCKHKGILVGRSPARNANAVAEFTFGLMIAITRKMFQANRQLLQREFLCDDSWKKRIAEPVDDIIWNSPELPKIPYMEFQSYELAGKTLGLVGLGAIGHMIADKAKTFDMKILAYDPYIAQVDSSDIPLVDLEELASRSDIVSLHAKETRETTNMINSAFFANMKDGSYLINTSRGKLVDRNALIEALETGKLAGAAIDVFDYEPLSKDDPLLDIENLFLTPHIGGASRDVVRHHSKATVKNIEAYCNGKNLVYPV